MVPTFTAAAGTAEKDMQRQRYRKKDKISIKEAFLLEPHRFLSVLSLNLFLCLFFLLEFKTETDVSARDTAFIPHAHQ